MEYEFCLLFVYEGVVGGVIVEVYLGEFIVDILWDVEGLVDYFVEVCGCLEVDSLFVYFMGLFFVF